MINLQYSFISKTNNESKYKKKLLIESKKTFKKNTMFMVMNLKEKL